MLKASGNLKWKVFLYQYAKCNEKQNKYNTWKNQLVPTKCPKGCKHKQPWPDFFVKGESEGLLIPIGSKTWGSEATALQWPEEQAGSNITSLYGLFFNPNYIWNSLVNFFWTAKNVNVQCLNLMSRVISQWWSSHDIITITCIKTALQSNSSIPAKKEWHWHSKKNNF